jgi:hypothetical protein
MKKETNKTEIELREDMDNAELVNQRDQLIILINKKAEELLESLKELREKGIL